MACRLPSPVSLHSQRPPNAARQTSTAIWTAPKADGRCPQRQQRCRRQWRQQAAAAEDGWADTLTDLLCEDGNWDASCPRLQACVKRADQLTTWLTEHEVGLQLAVQLALSQCRAEAAGGGGDDVSESSSSSTSSSSSDKPSASSSSSDKPSASSSDKPSSSSSLGGSAIGDSTSSSSLVLPLQAKFLLFRRLTSGEPGWATALARVLADNEAAAALPAGDSKAALRFACSQLQRVQLYRRRYEQLHNPYSLPRLFLLHPAIGGALMAQHPRGFQEHAAPWLRRQLGWGDADLACAALSPHFSDLCQLDLAAAQAGLDWLIGAAGLSTQQAAALLAPPGLRMLAVPPAQQALEQARCGQLAAAWGVPLGVATVLVLVQPPLTAGGAELTGRLAEALQGTVGMSEGQVLEFVLSGGLDGGCTRSEAALDRAFARLKQLLLVHGSWAAVAAALVDQPEQLSMSWQGLESMLDQPGQQAAWRAVGAMLAPVPEEG